MASGQGINFAEFTYQLLQSYDFLHLYQTANCRLQVRYASKKLHFGLLMFIKIGGGDQFGNITAGVDLISRYNPSSTSDSPAYGLTAPLLTTPSGEKFGKSAGNAVWLDGDQTCPFELYQVQFSFPRLS